MVDDDETLNEGLDYSPKSEFSKGLITQRAVEKCIEARGKEMRCGYWNTTLDKNGMPVKNWITDTRKEFIGSVIALRNLLYPEILNSKKYKNKEKKIRKDEQKLKEECIYKEKVLAESEEKRNPKKFIWKETGKKYLPEIGERVIIETISHEGYKEGNEINGGWDDKVNRYFNECVYIYDKVFAILNQLIADNGYFKSKISF